MTSLCPEGTQLYTACCQAYQKYCDQNTLDGCLGELEVYLAALDAWLRHVRGCSLCLLLSATAALLEKEKEGEKEECDVCSECEGCGH